MSLWSQPPSRKGAVEGRSGPGAAERPRKLRDKRRPTSALRTVADLMRGWQSYEAAEATLSDQDPGAGAEAAVLHSKLVAGGGVA